MKSEDLTPIPNVADQTHWYSCGADLGVLLHARVKVETSPTAGLYCGEVNTKVTLSSSGETKADNGVAYYSAIIKVHGTSLYSISSSGTGPWSDTKAGVITVTCGEEDVTLDVDAHSCTQREPQDPARSSHVKETYRVVTLSDFEITE